MGHPASWTYHKIDEGGQTVHIVDIGDHSKQLTITNDVERVASMVNALHPGWRIVYQDTAGRWDEIIHTYGKFEGFKFLEEILEELREE